MSAPSARGDRLAMLGSALIRPENILERADAQVGACRVSFYGAHISLLWGNRLELIECLTSHLTITTHLLKQLRVMQWQLRNISFDALVELFGQVTTLTAEYSQQLCARIKDCGGKVQRECLAALKSPTAFDDEHVVAFAPLLTSIQASVEAMAQFPIQCGCFIERANESDDYATHAMLLDLLGYASRIKRLVDNHVPREPHPA